MEVENKYKKSVKTVISNNFLGQENLSTPSREENKYILLFVYFEVKNFTCKKFTVKYF